MNRDDVDRWLDSYVQAWMTYDPDEIGELFSADIRYRYHPEDDPIEGREAVVASWLGETGNGTDRDDPGTYEAAYTTVAVEGDRAVATGISSYREEPGGPLVRVYDNCFVMQFDAEGRCREFTEWYMKRKGP